jgi:hypothetical protein
MSGDLAPDAGVKSSLAMQDAIPLRFDGSTPMWGEIAHAVGAKMRALAAKHQVPASLFTAGARGGPPFTS